MLTGGASALGGSLSVSTPAPATNSITVGATGNYLTGQPTVYSAAYQSPGGFGINANTAGDVGLKTPLGNSTSFMGATNLNTGGFSVSGTYRF